MPKSSKTENINFPDEINELANKFRRERLERERNATRQKAEREKQEKLIQSERLEKGLPCAEKIFNWVKSFSNSWVGKELMLASHIPTAYRNIFFFDGHVAGTKWVGFIVSADGLSLDSGGHWSTLGRKTVKSPSELASSVDTRILVAICEWIDNGKVWECIKRRFDYLSKDRTD